MEIPINVSNNKMSKGFYTTVNVFMYTRLLLGFYSKIQKTYAFAIVAKIYSLLFASVLVYFSLVYKLVQVTEFTAYISYILQIMHYFLTVLVSCLTDGEHLYNHIAEFDEVDPMGITEIENHKVLFSSFMFVLVLLLQVVRFYSLATLQVNINFITIYVVVLFSSNLSDLARVLMFEIRWIRMKSLRKAINKYSSNRDDNGSDASEEHVTFDIKTLNEYMLVYSKMTQIIKNIGNGSKFLMLTFLPLSLLNVLSGAHYISRKFYPANFRCYVVFELVVKVIQPCIPAILGELIKAEEEKIKITLTKQCRVCKDESLRRKILDSIKYIELCPIRFSVWRLFRVDMSLPLTLISICVTYAIVVLQFNKITI